MRTQCASFTEMIEKLCDMQSAIRQDAINYGKDMYYLQENADLLDEKKVDEVVAKSIDESEQQFDFTGRIEVFKKAADRSRVWFHSTEQINQLVRLFDEEVGQRRRVMTAQKLELPVLSACHKFFVAPTSNCKPPYGIYSEKYHSKLPPDKRLIFIGLDSSAWQTRLSVFHEIGHFIGIRKREDRLTKTFIPLVIQGLIQSIKYDMRRNFCFMPRNDHIRISFDNNILPKRSIEERQKLFTLLRTFEINLTAMVSEGVSSTFRSIPQLLHGQGYTTESIIDDEPVVRLQVAKTMGFLQYIRTEVLSVLYSALDKSHWSSDDDLKELIYSKCFSDAVDRRQKEIECALEKGKIPHWYTACEDQIEEAIADVFMMKMSNIPIKKYIGFLPDVYDVSYGRKNIRASYDVSMPPRFLGICMAANAKPEDFHRWYDFVVERIPFSCRAKRNLEMRTFLYKSYMEEKHHMNSQGELGKIHPGRENLYRYIEEIWNDEDYVDFCTKHEAFLSKLRKELCSPNLSLWRYFHWKPVTYESKSEISMPEETTSYLGT